MADPYESLRDLKRLKRHERNHARIAREEQRKGGRYIPLPPQNFADEAPEKRGDDPRTIWG